MGPSGKSCFKGTDLAPSLRPGQIVVLDPLSIHTVKRMHQAVLRQRLSLAVFAGFFARSVANRGSVLYTEAPP
jgi:hypothetical protein